MLFTSCSAKEKTSFAVVSSVKPAAGLLVISMRRPHKPSRAPWLHGLRAAPDGDDAGARDLDQAERQHQGDEALDLLGRAGDLEHEAFDRGVDHPGPEGVGETQGLDPVLALAADL